MNKSYWSIDELLSIGENVIYKCDIEDENVECTYKLYLTNYRIIWTDDETCAFCLLLKHICKYGMFVGYEDYHGDDDIEMVNLVSILEPILKNIHFGSIQKMYGKNCIVSCLELYWITTNKICV